VQRLKTRAQFEAVMAGATVSRTAHFALHRANLPTGPESERPQALFAVRDVWIGALTPKRWAKRAVTRNTVKRQIYTVSADFQDQLPQAAHVVRLRSGFDRKVFISATSEVLKKAVREELQQLFSRAAA
jgi:ribonuclease P protein component